MSSLIEVNIKEFPEITHYRQVGSNSSIYLIIGSRILEAISLSYFCSHDEDNSEMKSKLIDMIQVVSANYSNMINSSDNVKLIVEAITTNSSNVKESLDWVSGYAQHDEYSAWISAVFEHILWIKYETLSNREFEVHMLEEVLQIFSQIFQIIITLFSVSSGPKYFGEGFPERYHHILLLIDEDNNIFSVYGEEMIQIENGSMADQAKVLFSSSPTFQSIPTAKPPIINRQPINKGVIPGELNHPPYVSIEGNFPRSNKPPSVIENVPPKLINPPPNLMNSPPNFYSKSDFHPKIENLYLPGFKVLPEIQRNPYKPGEIAPMSIAAVNHSELHLNPQGIKPELKRPEPFPMMSMAPGSGPRMIPPQSIAPNPGGVIPPPSNSGIQRAEFKNTELFPMMSMPPDSKLGCVPPQSMAPLPPTDLQLQDNPRLRLLGPYSGIHAPPWVSPMNPIPMTNRIRPPIEYNPMGCRPSYFPQSQRIAPQYQNYLPQSYSIVPQINPLANTPKMMCCGLACEVMQCNHPKCSNCISMKFYATYKNFIQQLRNKNLKWLNEQKHGIGCNHVAGCYNSLCIPFEEVNQVALLVLKDEMLDEGLADYFALVFEEIPDTFSICKKCGCVKICFTVNYCYFCGS